MLPAGYTVVDRRFSAFCQTAAGRPLEAKWAPADRIAAHAATGKVRKFKLRARYWEGRERLVS